MFLVFFFFNALYKIKNEKKSSIRFILGTKKKADIALKKTPIISKDFKWFHRFHPKLGIPRIFVRRNLV